MPELPEVETVRRGLAGDLEGARIVGLVQRRPDLRHPLPENFRDRMTGRKILTLGRRAKYLLVNLDDGHVLVCHLGMSGSFRIAEAHAGGTAEPAGNDAFHIPRGKSKAHDHVIVHLQQSDDAPHSQTQRGSPARQFSLIYNDPRRFGFMHLLSADELSDHPMFANLGPEPTGNGLSAEGLAARLAGRRTPIKAALLDQSVIAGLGNIYVCEALWRAGLSPRRLAGSLVKKSGQPTERLTELTTIIRSVIDEAIDAGGSTLRDYMQADGSLGYFQFSFAAYGREGEACKKPDCTGTIKRLVQSGRSSFYCSHCQR